MFRREPLLRGELSLASLDNTDYTHLSRTTRGLWLSTANLLQSTTQVQDLCISKYMLLVTYDSCRSRYRTCLGR
jgi:hypothetical protein